MMVRNRVRQLASGAILKVTATDPSTTWDFPKFCTFMNHDGRDGNGITPVSILD